jgi:hypothetical protein
MTARLGFDRFMIAPFLYNLISTKRGERASAPEPNDHII